EFLQRLPPEQRHQRFGHRLPLVPDLPEGGSAADLVDRSAHWVCTALVPTSVYRLFLQGPEAPDAAARGNARLYQLLDPLWGRRQTLARVLRGVTTGQGGPPLYAGCYLAATGREAPSQQAFVPGVFRRLLDEQNYVCWTAEAAREEARYHRWARCGYVGLAAGGAAPLTLGCPFWGAGGGGGGDGLA